MTNFIEFQVNGKNFKGQFVHQISLSGSLASYKLAPYIILEKSRILMIWFEALLQFCLSFTCLFPDSGSRYRCQYQIGRFSSTHCCPHRNQMDVQVCALMSILNYIFYYYYFLFKILPEKEVVAHAQSPWQTRIHSAGIRNTEL